ncbi:MAG: zinc ribbon domain-containing protein [Chloroflexi bacterium]|nr:zinc ribbon domain-containing protein [Chloroflexota bacterium]
MIYCPACGTANRDGSRFCNECGGRLDQSIGLLCPNCNASNPLGTLHCSQCGAPLVPSTSGLQDQAGEPGYEEALSAETPPLSQESEAVPAVSLKALPEWLYQEEDETEIPAPEAPVEEASVDVSVPNIPEMVSEVHAKAQPSSPTLSLSSSDLDRAPISGPLAGIAGVLPLPEEYDSAQRSQRLSPVQWWPKPTTEKTEPRPTAGRGSRAESLAPGLIAVVVVVILLVLALFGILVAQGVIRVPGR